MANVHKHLPICKKDKGLCRIVDVYASGDVLNEEEMHRKVREAFEQINSCGAKERKMYNLDSRRRQTILWCDYGIRPDRPPSDEQEIIKKREMALKRKAEKKKENLKNKNQKNGSESCVSWDDLDNELAKNANWSAEWEEMINAAQSAKLNEDCSGSKGQWDEKLKEWKEMLDAERGKGEKKSGKMKETGDKEKDCIVID